MDTAKLDAACEKMDSISKRFDGLSKQTIAKEAVRQLNGIKDIIRENGNWNIASLSHGSMVQSVNNYMRAAQEGGEEIPGWITAERKFLSTKGWKIP